MRIEKNMELDYLASTVHIQIVDSGCAYLDERWSGKNIRSPFSRLYYILGGSGTDVYKRQRTSREVFCLGLGQSSLFPWLAAKRYPRSLYPAGPVPIPEAFPWDRYRLDSVPESSTSSSPKTFAGWPPYVSRAPTVPGSHCRCKW